MKTVRLVEEKQQELWNKYKDFNPIFKEVGAPLPPKEHLEHIEKEGGEKIILLSEDEQLILGWIGIVPEKGESWAELAGIEVHEDYRCKGYGTKLILEGQKYLTEKGIGEFHFSTCPLMISNNLLYLNKFNTSYKWNNTMAIPIGNIPWPVVDCTMKWPNENQDVIFPQEVKLRSISLLKWKGNQPELIEGDYPKGRDYQIVELPNLGLMEILETIKEGKKEICVIPFDLFNKLAKDGFSMQRIIKRGTRYYLLFLK